MDDSGTRLTSGTFGLWAFNGGSKYWDDLTVESLSIVEPTPTATPTNTPVPPTETSYTTTQRITLSLAGQRIAVRELVKDETGTVTSSHIHYYLTDHLGSTSQMLNHVGNVYVGGSAARHTPFGDYRTTPTADNTDLGFTGHRENRSLGLTYMNARFYVAGIGRFASADIIIPDPTNPQSYNRFSYVLNSPLNFNDPSGHMQQKPEKDIDGTRNETLVLISGTSLLAATIYQIVFALAPDFNWNNVYMWNQGIDVAGMWAQHDANQANNELTPEERIEQNAEILTELGVIRQVIHLQISMMKKAELA
ncbi:MAG: RHS repeat-associated core domain-containing protein [Chloroflexota bacterium]